MWIEVEDGHLPLGAPKVVSEDDDVMVKNGQFVTEPLWLPVPNTRFTKKGWPKSIEVDDRLKPFPAGKFKIRFESYFNGAWQTPEVLAILGGDYSKKLNGPIIKATDKDVIDSPKVVDYVATLPFPPLSSEAKAINLVRAIILTVPGKGRSSGDVQANVDLFMSSPGIKAGKGWAAKRQRPTIYQVTYDFIDGTQGDEQAIWSANIASGEVKYVNENAKIFSWTPDF